MKFVMSELYKQYRKRDKRNQWSILVQTEVNNMSVICNRADVNKSDSSSTIRSDSEIKERRPNNAVIAYAYVENKFLKTLD